MPRTELTMLLYFQAGEYIPTREEVEEAFDCDVIEYEEEEV